MDCINTKWCVPIISKPSDIGSQIMCMETFSQKLKMPKMLLVIFSYYIFTLKNDERNRRSYNTIIGTYLYYYIHEHTYSLKLFD